MIKRQQVLLEEIDKVKEENEELESALAEKQREFGEAQEVNAILSMRINYMITNKFLTDVNKVLDEVEYRHINDAFDAIIDEANNNLTNRYSDFDY
jgi:TATA-binding protein-associated factor Taf7